MLNEIDLSRTDLNLLTLFEVVLDERHVGRAAERLNLTPSAISHGLGRLRRLLNDPLFLKTPKGMVPTERALALALPVATVLAGARQVVASAVPFDPLRSTRRFTIGAPDGESLVFLLPLLDRLRQVAPKVDIALTQLLPPQRGRQLARAWEPVLDELESRALDIAVVPLETLPARFTGQLLYREDFIIATRAGHLYAVAPSLDTYCAAAHLVVSLTGDPYGFMDALIAAQGRTRRVALTVPNFMTALAVVAETDLATALPRRFAAIDAARYGVVASEPPLPPTVFTIQAVATKAALMDAGVAWLFDLLAEVSPR